MLGFIVRLPNMLPKNYFSAFLFVKDVWRSSGRRLGIVNKLSVYNTVYIGIITFQIKERA